MWSLPVCLPSRSELVSSRSVVFCCTAHKHTGWPGQLPRQQQLDDHVGSSFYSIQLLQFHRQIYQRDAVCMLCCCGKEVLLVVVSSSILAVSVSISGGSLSHSPEESGAWRRCYIRSSSTGLLFSLSLSQFDGHCCCC